MSENEKEIPAATRAVTSWLETFSALLAKGDAKGAAALFTDDCFWRDLVSFTWNITTLEGPAAIGKMLEATLAAVKPSSWKIEGDGVVADGMSEAWFTFETAVSRGRGHVRLRDGKAWTLLTTMTELKGHEEKKGPRRVKGAEHGVAVGRKSWLDKRTEEQAQLGHEVQPYCVVIGGGQGGIALGARLKRLGVPTIILEKNARAGDSWRNRYKALCLHDPVWYDHLPYLPFPDDWPVFAPKDKLGDWLEMYTKVMELDYWTSSEATKASFDETKQEWTVEVARKVDGRDEKIVLHPKQLIFALGVSGMPNQPKYEGAESFEGKQHHSSRHPSGAEYKGKKCVVIGSNNSAHDICADLWEHGADVTMVQRSSTHIVRSDSLMEVVLGGLYSEEAVQNGITTDKADMVFASIPYKVLPAIHIPAFAEIQRRDEAFYAALAKAGFKLDHGVDGSGLFVKYLRRGSGYYIDVGASQLVADGKIKLKAGDVNHVEKNAVVFKDGTELAADLIVYATGYGSMNGWVAKIASQEMADKVGKVWGLGSDTPKDPGPWEGELRNMWKPTQQDSLWFHGGNLHQSRHYSQFLSLQLKARMEGIPTPVYGLQPSHHKS
jgi:putative flavoprotein involved in K+ transport